MRGDAEDGGCAAGGEEDADEAAHVTGVDEHGFGLQARDEGGGALGFFEAALAPFVIGDVRAVEIDDDLDAAVGEDFFEAVGGGVAFAIPEAGDEAGEWGRGAMLAVEHGISIARRFELNQPKLDTMNAESISNENVIWLRWEGAWALAFFALAYRHMGASWWVFAGLFLLPDLSMLGYLLNARTGALLYNLAHTYSVPAGLAALQWIWSGQFSALWLIWFAHIGFDRMMGYGLKEKRGFRFTHLGAIGRAKAGESR